jgi:predicted P-loop ATPase
MSGPGIDSFTPKDREMFARFQVPETLLASAQVERVTDAEARQRDIRKKGNNAGLLFNYYDPTLETLNGSAPWTSRLRRDATTGDRYLCPPKAKQPRHLYVIPGHVAALKDTTIPVVFVEAEKSVLALTAWAERNGLSFLLVGTGGCGGWLCDGAPLLDFNLLTWQGRKAVILFDGDAKTNENVARGQSRLTEALGRRGAKVSLAAVPLKENVKGPDDLIAVAGDQAMADVLNSAVPFAGNWRTGLLYSKDASVKPLLANAALYLENSPEWTGVLVYDQFSLEVKTAEPPPWDQGQADAIWTDAEDSLTAIWLQRHSVQVNSKIAGEAARVVARKHGVHPVQQYLKNLVWDKKPRIDCWCHDCLGAADTALNAAIGAKWLISAVARIMRPGCKADYTLLLIGPQGASKSTSLQILAGPQYFTDWLSDMAQKDARIELHGKWIVEISEFTNRRSELERKGFLTATHDSFRPPYERTTRQVPRSNVFSGTSNDDTPLSDATGGRRYWPVAVGKIDLEKLKADRDQIWAEAYCRYLEGESWYDDFPEFRAALKEEQDAHYQGGPNDEAILEWLAEPKRGWESQGGALLEPFDSNQERVTIADILLHCLNIPRGKADRKDQLAVRECLIHARWNRDKKQTKVPGTKRVVHYYRKEAIIL